MSTLQDSAAHLLRFSADAPPEELVLRLVVNDPDTLLALSEIADPLAREEYASAALRIGVLALKHARGRVDADLIQREGERMLKAMEDQLSEHSSKVHERLANSLRDYFDPENGSFHQRINALVRRDGELEQVLRKQVGHEESELSKTLLNHVGQQSPLFKLLNPQESAGLVTALKGTFEEALTKQKERVLAEFSLDNKQGALSRLVEELTQTHGNLQAGLGKQIDHVVKQFSLDEENSALSRLVQSVSQAQRTITSEFSLDNDTSALSRLAKILDQTQSVIHGQLTLDDETSSLARLRKELLELIKTYDTANRAFQEEVKVSLAQLTARKQEAARGTQHGLHFEDALCECLERLAHPTGDIFARVGTQTGLVRNSKKGDAVWELGPESAAPGERIVFEAKEDRSYDFNSAREEIAQARENRGAQLGIFVFSCKSVLPSQEPLTRIGPDIFVVWDAENALTDMYLKCAVTIAKALCIQRKGVAEEHKQDFEQMIKAVNEIEKQTKELDQVSKWAESIQGSSEKIIDRVRISKKSLERQIESLKERIQDLRAAESEAM